MLMVGDPDGDLLHRFSTGDADAFETLFRKFEREVYRWVNRIVREPSDAEDVVVEAFWRAHRGCARFDPARSFGAWIRRIATNAALDHLRATRTRPVSHHANGDRLPARSVDTGLRESVALALGLYLKVAKSLDSPSPLSCKIFQMMKNAPGKAYRTGITLKQILRMFPNDEIAEQWFTEQRWPNGVCCPACGSVNVQTGCQHKTMPYRCREKECTQKFSAKTGTVMEGSKVGYQDWLLAAFLLITSLKSVSSMKLHRDLGVTQKTAWFLAQRLRVALSQERTLFAVPVEVDETYVGGRRRNLSNTTRMAVLLQLRAGDFRMDGL